MIAAPTAASLLKAVAANKRQADAARIVDLIDAEREAVVDALRGVKGGSRIDVKLLIAETRARLAEAAARRPPADPGIYERHLIAQGYQPYYMSAAAQAVAGDAEPDEDVDDDDEDQPKRRSIPRLRSRRLMRKPKSKPEPAFVGGKMFGADDSARPYGCPEGVDYEAWRNPSRPAWLLSDSDGDVEPDTEGAAA